MSNCNGGCQYSDLRHYNKCPSHHRKHQENALGYQVVPVFGQSGYDSLVHCTTNCNGNYPNIMDAYRVKDPNSYNQQYVKRPCSGMNHCR